MKPPIQTTAQRLDMQAGHERMRAVINAVDERGRMMDRKWGFGQLPRIVGSEWAARFATAQTQFSRACYDLDFARIEKYGAALERGYDKLDEIATQAGCDTSPPEQWEDEGPLGLVILVRYRHDVGRVDTKGRAANVWSFEEVLSVIESQKLIVEAKARLPGVTVESVRPKVKIEHLDDPAPF